MSARQFNLPLLPGFSFNGNIGRECFRKKQYFSRAGKICMVDDGRRTLMPGLYSSGLVPDVPPWLLFDKQILTFDADFQNESVVGIVDFNRPVKILYYLEDGTMKVVEPKTDNSGLYQGTIVGRQRIPLPNSDEYYEVIDLNVGKDVEIYGKKFTIVDCDRFTRSFLEKLGVKVPEPVVVGIRNCCESQRNHSTKPPKEMKSSVQFFEFDRKLLRFTGYWDNRESENGELHHLEILYYLADDTIEIREMFAEKSKKDRNAVFLKRCTLPKEMPQCMVATHGAPIETYCPSDLSIGAPINVYGRMIILTDCDEFTKEYYRSKYAIDKFDPIPPPEPLIKPVPIKLTPPDLPPWNGFGTHNDSAGNCNTLMPKAPRCDFYKFLEKDSIGHDSHILRFSARLLSDVPENEIRRFIVSYYLRDDTLSVFEVKIRNSGFRGGMFYKRDSVMLPGSEEFAHRPPSYTIGDMWIGNVLVVNNHRFILTNADKYTFEYMEGNSVEFPKSNVTLIIDKIRSQLLTKENCYKDFVARNLQHLVGENHDMMSHACFEQALKEIVGGILTEHEFISVLRFYRIGEVTFKNRDAIRSSVHTYVQRYLWQDHVRLLEHFKYLDEDDCGYLPRRQVFHVLRANRLPIPNDLLEDVLDVIAADDLGRLSYTDVMDFLDFKLKPAKPIIAVPAKTTKYTQRFQPAAIIADHPIRDSMINWDAFVRELNLEHTLLERP